jgi:S1-C subfamily serine protease
MDDSSENLSRRNFIKTLVGATSLGMAASPVLAWMLSLKFDEEPGKILSSTATAVAKTGKETSFVPDKNFSREFFDQVRLSTWLVVVEGVRSDQDMDIRVMWGATGFAVERGEDLYLVTNRHVLVSDAGGMVPKKIWLGRPGRQKGLEEKNILGWAATEQSDPDDLGVVKLDLRPEERAGVFLPIETAVAGKEAIGEKVLVVGFPAIFTPSVESDFNLERSAVMASAAEVTRVGGETEAINGNLVMEMAAAVGASGSPVVRKRADGKPEVIAVVQAISQEQYKNVTYATTLNKLEGLIAKIEEKG